MDDSTSLRLCFDYVDPASYLLDLRLRLRAGPTTFRLIRTPFEAALPVDGLLDPESPPIVRHWEEMSTAAAAMGLELRRPWIVPWSRKAHELAFHGKKKGCFEEIHDALFEAYLLEGRDIGRVDVLVEMAGRAGMDERDVKVALDVDSHLEAVLGARGEALDLGVRRPPTLLWMGRRLEGYPDDATLEGFLALEDDRDNPNR